MGYVRALRRGKLAAWTALGAALACAGAMAAPGVTQAQATPIRHVVVIYLENHSFDNLLGYWCDAHPGRCPDGGMPASVRLSNGAMVTPSTDPDTVPVVQHSVAAQAAAIDGGKMDGWQKVGRCAAATGYRCISGYRPGQVPNITALAQHFAISDRTFSLGDSPSWAGHMDIVAASADGFYGDIPVRQKGVAPGPGWGCDSNRVTPWITPNGRLQTVPSCVPAHLPGLRFGGAFEPTPVNPESTIMDRLDAAGLSWKLYGTSRSQNGYIWSICPSFAQCLDTRQDANLVPDAQFTADAALGVLPAFSVVTPGGPDYLNGCHNAMSITACGNWVGQLVGAVEHGPDWRSTAVFITWDDCGCFYDQVRPGVNPDGTAQGPRVPLIIVSPYARPRLHRHHRDHVRRDPRLHRAHLRPVRAGGQRRRVLVRQGLQLRPATTQTGAHDPPPAPRIGQAHSSHPFHGERPDLIRPRSLGAGGRVLPAV
jgi:phospholipase C